MSRQDRIKEYANPQHGPSGIGRDQDNIDYWSARAKENSQLAPRASDGPMKLPNTGKQQQLRESTQKPFEPRNVNARMEGRADLNHAGSDFMKNTRRSA